MINKIKFHLMRSVPNLAMKRWLAERAAKRVGKAKNYKGSTVLPSQLDAKEGLKSLEESGFCDFGQVLDQKMIDEIMNSVKALKCFDPFRANLDSLDPMDPPAETHVANYRRSELSRLEPILKLANDPSILNIVASFLGAQPTISNVNMWWSYSGHNEAEQAQNFHRDFDDIKFCKLFIYLTDVEKENGPHVFVKGSSNQSKLLKIKRYTDSQIEEAFGPENILEFVRPKGSMFLVDTYGFHKGLLPQKGNRLILQIQYSLGPILIENYEPQAIGNRKRYDPYVNRLILDQS